MVELVAGHNLVLDSLMEMLDRVLWSQALKDEEVLNSELSKLVPPDLQPILGPVVDIQQIKHFLIVDLVEGAADSEGIAFSLHLSRREQVTNSSESDTFRVEVICDDGSRVLILEAFHGMSLSTAC